MGTRCEPGAAPATVTGEHSRTKPLGKPGKAALKAKTREPGDLPVTCRFLCAGGVHRANGERNPRVSDTQRVAAPCPWQTAL